MPILYVLVRCLWWGLGVYVSWVHWHQLLNGLPGLWKFVLAESLGKGVGILLGTANSTGSVVRFGDGLEGGYLETSSLAVSQQDDFRGEHEPLHMDFGGSGSRDPEGGEFSGAVRPFLGAGRAEGAGPSASLPQIGENPPNRDVGGEVELETGDAELQAALLTKRESVKGEVLTLLRLCTKMEPKFTFFNKVNEDLQIDRSDLARLQKMSQAIHAYLGMSGILSGKEAAQNLLQTMKEWDRLP